MYSNLKGKGKHNIVKVGDLFENTVRCSEDEYGKYMYFDDVFNKLMEL